MPAKKNVLSEDLIALKGIEYFNKKETIKELDSQCKECRKPLEAYLDSNGRTTESGSRLVVIPHADVEVHLKKTLRVSKVLLPEAMDVLKENGLEECIENVPMIREDVLESMYMSGKVSPDVLKKIYQEKSSFAFSVDVKQRFEGE